MDGYARSPDITFISGDNFTRGWQTVHDRYQKNYDSREKMGTLTFSDLETRVLSNDAAVTIGRWHLQLANRSASRTVHIDFSPHQAGLANSSRSYVECSVSFPQLQASQRSLIVIECEVSMNPNSRLLSNYAKTIVTTSGHRVTRIALSIGKSERAESSITRTFRDRALFEHPQCYFFRALACR